MGPFTMMDIQDDVWYKILGRFGNPGALGIRCGYILRQMPPLQYFPQRSMLSIAFGKFRTGTSTKAAQCSPRTNLVIPDPPPHPLSSPRVLGPYSAPATNTAFPQCAPFVCSISGRPKASWTSITTTPGPGSYEVQPPGETSAAVMTGRHAESGSADASSTPGTSPRTVTKTAEAILRDLLQVLLLSRPPPPPPAAALCRVEGGVEVRIFRNSAIFLNFPQNFPPLHFASPPRVLVGALCVPCAEAMLLEASGALITAFSCEFPAIFRNWIWRSLTAMPPAPRRSLSPAAAAAGAASVCPHARLSAVVVPSARCSASGRACRRLHFAGA